MKPASHAVAAQRAKDTRAEIPAGPPRRNVLAAIAAVIIGGIVSAVPLAAGLLVFLDPILKRKSSGAAGEASEHGADKPFLRVASLESIPNDGKPVQVPVLSDLVDAWNREVNQPVGAVYLLRQGDKVQCFNAICPHAGCFVGYTADRNVFQCPCHTSSFEVDGSRILPSPSPRSMDALTVELKDGDVWVKFMNFYPGKPNAEVKG